MSTPEIRLFEAEATRSIRLPLIEYRPEGPPPATGWPLVLFLHGAGEKGTDGAAIADAALPRLITGGLTLSAIVICPQCPPGPGWPTADLGVLLDALIARDNVDAGAIHVTGISMGGRGAWELAYWRHADLASIAAVCAFGIPTLAPLLSALPAWIVHGSNDDVVPVARSADMATALEQAGGDVRYIPLDGVGHDCGDAAYGDPALWRWMLCQRRGDQSA